MSDLTAGPWHVDGEAIVTNQGHTESVHEIRNEHGLTVGYIHETDDSRLVAAAPELLGALKELVRVGTVGWPHREKAEAVRAAETAIAKAEGTT